MRAHFLQNSFLFLLVHNSEFLENVMKNYNIVSDHILMWSSAEWVTVNTWFLVYGTALREDVTAASGEGRLHC